MIQTDKILPNKRERLYNYFAGKLTTAENLNRKVVSFQANKTEPIYRWFKYKEGFSSSLVKYFLTKYSPNPGKLLDPFAGTGTALFAAQHLGWKSYGIEILPVGIFVMKTREALCSIPLEKLHTTINNLWNDFSQLQDCNKHIHHISITKDAFPEETELSLDKYLTFCATIEDKNVQQVLRFAAFSVLEEISFTRKDGQYLRWDYRSKRTLSGKPFDKGEIETFEQAVTRKLNQLVQDLSSPHSHSLFDLPSNNGHQPIPLTIVEGSCLEELPMMEENVFDFIITSPPYCNRYDYTRTYALELVYLGYDHTQVRDLRQSLLSCTVENKDKIDYLNRVYSSLGKLSIVDAVLSVYNNSEAMTETNDILEELNTLNRLNNNNIPRMVKNYFLELCFTIFEMARIIKPGGYCVMVNDNVRYGGEEIPVDLILSEFAEKFGFNVREIFVLPKGKGNSSQQMGNYGRTEIRKCVYVWQKI